MARTRNASAHYDVMLDKQGQPISPSAAYLAKAPNLSGGTVLKGPGAEPAPPPPAYKTFRADRRSWSKNMEAYELALLLDLAFRHPGKLREGFIVDLEEPEYLALSGDVRRHFLGVRDDG